MAAISRVQVQFTGPAVIGPSSTSFFTTGQLDDFRTPLTVLWTVLAQQMPPTCTVTIPNTGETFEDDTGALIELWGDGNTFTVVGQGTPVYAAGCGGRIVWTTSSMTNNRRVRGSNFIVPIGSGSYDANGTIADGVVNAWATACQVFRVATATAGHSIWTRPKNGAGGKPNGVTGHLVPDKVATLRSRRT